MDNILKLILIILTVLLLFAIYKIIILKKALRGFAEELEKHKDTEYAQPVKVNTFDKDVVHLAVKFNEIINQQHKLTAAIDENSTHLGNVISGMAHDFRTPLTSSFGYLQMIEKSNELSDKNIKYLKIVLKKIKYLKELSDDLFNFTNLENSNDKIQICDINLSNVVIESILEQNSWIEERKINTEFDVADGIMIKTDQHYLTRIMNNIFSNAQKYSVDFLGVALNLEDGRSVLRVYNNLADTNNFDCHKVFEPFYRMDSRSENGTGLGLYVVDSLAKKINIKVKALINKNGYFEIILLF